MLFSAAFIVLSQEKRTINFQYLLHERSIDNNKV